MRKGREYIVLFIIVFLWASCKSKEKVFDYSMPDDVDEEMMVQSVLNNQLNYNTLYFKRMMLEFVDNGKSKSVRANMYIKKDSTIIISVIPIMGIEIFRISLDSSSIRVIARLNRKFITSSYDYLANNYGIIVNYKIIESLITNSIFSYPEGTTSFLSKYSGRKFDAYYSLKSVDDRSYKRLLRRNSDIYLHEIIIMPNSFKVQNTSLMNVSKSFSMNVVYSSFIEKDISSFPENISIDVKQKDKVYNLVFSYKDFEIDGTNILNFRLPDKYEVTIY